MLNRECEAFKLSKEPLIGCIDGKDVPVMFLYCVKKGTDNVTSIAQVHCEQQMLYVHTLVGSESSNALKIFSKSIDSRELGCEEAILKAHEILI